MHRLALYLVICLASFSCSSNRLEFEVSEQEGKVIAAQEIFGEETKRLAQMRDSLQLKIQQNLDLGLNRKQAEDMEASLLKSQEALVKAARLNLVSQQDYLKQLKTHGIVQKADS